MKFYHFTQAWRVPFILKEGIYKGDVPTSLSGGFNAPWLTSDPNPQNQLWAFNTGKKGARIVVEIPETDPNLLWWPAVASAFKTPEWWYNALAKTGGGHPEHWWIYMGVIRPEWIYQG